jgi:hypothetical protein
MAHVRSTLNTLSVMCMCSHARQQSEMQTHSGYLLSSLSVSLSLFRTPKLSNLSINYQQTHMDLFTLKAKI